MSELVTQTDVTGGVHTGVGSLQPIVDHHPAPIGFDTHLGKAQILYVGRAAYADQDFVDRQGLALSPPIERHSFCSVTVRVC